MQPSHKHMIPLNQDHSQKQKNIPQWRKAMNEEFDVYKIALLVVINSTWALALPQPTQNIIGCTISYQRFQSMPNCETHNRSCDSRHCCLKGWHLHQLDINNAFLQDTIEDEVFIEQPHGFIDPQNPSYACKLRKAIYGLCQASRAWYNELHEFLLDFGFINAHMDTSLFIFHHGNLTLLWLVYVDDIILIGTSHGFIDQFVTTLANQFSLNDLDALSYFL
ncbi:hypothetical protein AAG906_033902 [Vitis piasezkii]